MILSILYGPFLCWVITEEIISFLFSNYLKSKLHIIKVSSISISKNQLALTLKNDLSTPNLSNLVCPGMDAKFFLFLSTLGDPDAASTHLVKQMAHGKIEIYLGEKFRLLKRAGDIAQWWSACLTCIRPQVQSPTLQKQDSKNKN